MAAKKRPTVDKRTHIADVIQQAIGETPEPPKFHITWGLVHITSASRFAQPATATETATVWRIEGDTYLLRELIKELLLEQRTQSLQTPREVKFGYSGVEKVWWATCYPHAVAKLCNIPLFHTSRELGLAARAGYVLTSEDEALITGGATPKQVFKNGSGGFVDLRTPAEETLCANCGRELDTVNPRRRYIIISVLTGYHALCPECGHKFYMDDDK